MQFIVLFEIGGPCGPRAQKGVIAATPPISAINCNFEAIKIFLPLICIGILHKSGERGTKRLKNKTIAEYLQAIRGIYYMVT